MRSAKLVHGLLHDRRQGVVEGVAASRAWKKASGFCAVPRSTGRSGVIARRGVRQPAPHRANRAGRRPISSSILATSCDVRKPVEEMQEGHAALRVAPGRCRRSRALPARNGAEHGEAGLAAGHHVGMIAEDGQGVRGQRAGRDVHAEAGQFAGDLVHVGDHQQQALRGGEGGGQRCRLAGRRGRRRWRPPSDCISVTWGIVSQMFRLC